MPLSMRGLRMRLPTPPLAMLALAGAAVLAVASIVTPARLPAAPDLVVHRATRNSTYAQGSIELSPHAGAVVGAINPDTGAIQSAEVMNYSDQTATVEA